VFGTVNLVEAAGLCKIDVPVAHLVLNPGEVARPRTRATAALAEPLQPNPCVGSAAAVVVAAAKIAPARPLSSLGSHGRAIMAGGPVLSPPRDPARHQH